MAKKIVGFQIDVVGTTENKNKIAELAQEIQKLQDVKSKLDAKIKEGEQLSKNEELQYAKTVTAIKFLSAEKNKLINTQVKEIANANALDKSYNSLVARNAKLADELRRLADPLGKDKVAFQALAKEIKENTEELKEMDEAMGRHHRNVGDYASAITGAANEMGIFGSVGANVTQVMKSMQSGFTVVKAGFSSLKGAIISTGIGALVIALGSLVAWFSKTREGALLFERGLNILGAAASAIFDRVIQYGKNLFEFGKSLVNIGGIMKGIFTGDIEKIKTSWGAMTDAAGKFAASQKDLWTGLWDNIKNVVSETDKLTIANQNLRDSERELKVEFATKRAEIEKLKFLSEDITKSEGERAEATKKAFSIEKDLLDKSISLQQQKIINLQKEDQLKGAQAGQEEYLNQLADLRVELENKKAESYTKQTELQNKLNALEKQREDRINKLIEQLGKIETTQQEAAKGSMELTDAQIEQYQKLSDEIARSEEEKREEFRQTAEFRKELEGAIFQTSIQAASDIANARAQIHQQEAEHEFNRNMKHLEQMRDSGLYSEESFQKEKEKLERKAFKDNQERSKAAIRINAAIAVVNALATTKPFVMGVIAAAGIAVTAAAQISTINKQKFARGGLVVGRGTENSDSIDASLSNNESVNNALSTRLYSPLLSALNVSAGGAPIPTPSGSIAGTVSKASELLGLDNMANKIVAGINSKKVVLVESEVTDVQNKISVIQASSRF